MGSEKPEESVDVLEQNSSQEHSVAGGDNSTGVIQGDKGTEAAQVWIGAFLIVALGFVTYLYAFSIPLHGADLDLLGGESPVNRTVTSLEALPEMPGAPLSLLGLSLNSAMGGVDVLHGVSILIHLLCGVLVFLIARCLVPRGTPEAVCMLAGMLFVVHPIVSEPVNYLVARSVLQSSLFGLGGLYILLRGLHQQMLWAGDSRVFRSVFRAGIRK